MKFLLEVYNQSNILKLHYDFRCHFLPIGMLSNDNRQLSYHTWSLAYTLYLDILLCSEVLSGFKSLKFDFFFIWLRFVIVSLYWFPYIDLLNYKSKKLGLALKFVTCTCVLPSVLIFTASGWHCWECYRWSCLWIFCTNICYFWSCRGRKREQTFPLFYCMFHLCGY